MPSSSGIKPFPYRIVDLTHTLAENIPSWEGKDGFSRTTVHDYKEIGFRVQRLEMDAGIGTHMDAPCHKIAGGATIDALALSDLIAPCVVIDVSHKADERYKVTVEDVEEFERRYGTIGPRSFVIIRTGWDQLWNTPEKYRNNLVFPTVSLEAAKLLVKRHISGLGIDTLSPDRPEEGFGVHQALLGAQKYIVENVANAGLLPPVGGLIVCLPIKVEGAAEAPVRLVGLVLETKDIAETITTPPSPGPMP